MAVTYTLFEMFSIYLTFTYRVSPHQHWKNKLENEKDCLLNIFFEKIKVILSPAKNKRSMLKA